MTPTAKAISEQICALGDPSIAEHSTRFFKTGPGEYGEGDRFLGIRVPELRRLIKPHRATPLAEVEGLLREVGKRDKSVETDFLATRYRHMPRTMLRYALEKFPQAERRAYLEERVG